MWSLACTAVSRGQKERVEKLLESDKELVKEADSMGITLLHYCVGSTSPNSAEIANLLLLRGAELDGLTNVNRTPLMFAAAEGNFECVKLLIERYNDSMFCSFN
jgi:ankyrin repeat protein